MSNRDHLSAVTLELLIVAVGLLGVLLLLALGMAWRNYHRRQRELDQRRRKKKLTGPAPSAWEEAGRRYHDDEGGKHGDGAGGPD